MSNNQLVKKEEQTMAQRFTNKVITIFSQSSGQEIALTKFQKRLAQNYCVTLDGILKKAEQGRLKKSEKYRNDVPVVWQNVDMEELAEDVVSAARIGFDPAQTNHVNMIPFFDKPSGKYKIGFIEGYRGKSLKATKYGLNVPDAVAIELVHTNDKFKVIKKDRNNPVETYEFEVANAFDRGEILGGFYYHIYKDNEARNKLVTFTLQDILKRKPEHASTEFWGGEKDVWKDGKKTGEKESVGGWYKEMCWKTIYRAAYSDVTIDSQKIDDDYMRLKKLESDLTETNVQVEIEENANQEFIDIEADPVDDVEYVEEVEITPEPRKEAPKQKGSAGKQATIDDGPGY